MLYLCDDPVLNPIVYTGILLSLTIVKHTKSNVYQSWGYWLVRSASRVLQNTTKSCCSDHESMMSAADSVVERMRTAGGEERTTAASSSPSACLAHLFRNNSSRCEQAANNRSNPWVCSCGHDFRDAVVHDRRIPW